MTRYFAWNRTKSVSGVHSSRTSVSLSGSAFLPCQSLLKRRGAESSQDDEDGNPSASSASIIRTATAVRSWDVASYANILVYCPRALQCSHFETPHRITIVQPHTRRNWLSPQKSFSSPLLLGFLSEPVQQASRLFAHHPFSSSWIPRITVLTSILPSFFDFSV